MTLLGGGDLNPADLAESLSLAPKLVAADSGADAALSLGYRPCAVVGDLDSISDHARVSLPDGAFIHVAEQESTDFHKALSRIDAPGVLALGFTGGRSDHELAAWHTLMAQRAPRAIVLGGADLVFLCPADLTLRLPIGTRVSLFPLAPVSGTSQGLEWPIDGLDFAPGRRIGTSNRSVAASVRLTMDAAAMLVILPKAHLRIVSAALF
ncbi:thiamine diphosphokinase [Alterinioella nitratireducens]|uniref:thiamine diphosphokinase n=1 Tax=Alterinioella nitratireducens TaxID=2735915 RepID=UPI004058D4D1